MPSGNVFGALDPNSKAAGKHAERYYAFVRSTNSDIEKIAANTGIDKKTIQIVKEYLFLAEHNLGGTIKKFDSNYEIAQSWQRLWLGKNILRHDLILIQHEKYEYDLIKSGIAQNRAHILASKKYNYAQEVRNYYVALNKH